MRKETLSGTILSIKYQAILLPRKNQVLPLCLILYFQKERRKSQKLQKLQKMHLQKIHLNLHLHLHQHPHWRQSKNDHTLQEQGSQHEGTLGNQPAHNSDFYMRDTILTWISGYPVQCWTLQKVVKKLRRQRPLVQCHIYI